MWPVGDFDNVIADLGGQGVKRHESILMTDQKRLVPLHGFLLPHGDGAQVRNRAEYILSKPIAQIVHCSFQVVHSMTGVQYSSVVSGHALGNMARLRFDAIQSPHEVVVLSFLFMLEPRKAFCSRWRR